MSIVITCMGQDELVTIDGEIVTEEINLTKIDDNVYQEVES